MLFNIFLDIVMDEFGILVESKLSSEMAAGVRYADDTLVTAIFRNYSSPLMNLKQPAYSGG